jgi:hypothetical protein
MSRVVFILVTAFWLTMNVLLWQTQFGSRRTEGSVPVAIVWEKILTAPDDSSLTVLHQGRLVGACHLRTAVGEQWSAIGDENVPSGPPEKNRGYRLRLDGSAVVPEWTNRIRFDAELKFDRGHAWQDMTARVTVRPVTWEIHSVAAEKNIHLKMEGGGSAFNVVLNFSDLQNPSALTYKLLGPAAAELTAEAGLPSVPSGSSAAGLGLMWDAYDDTLRIGHSVVQVYRLHTRLLDRYDLNMIVSRAGEILRVQLPNDTLLLNDHLASAEQRQNRKPATSNSEGRAPASPLSRPPHSE